MIKNKTQRTHTHTHISASEYTHKQHQQKEYWQHFIDKVSAKDKHNRAHMVVQERKEILYNQRGQLLIFLS